MMQTVGASTRPDARTMSGSAQLLSAEERDRVRNQVKEACQPVAQVWPLRTFAYRSPVRGYEYLPFDEAVRAARHTLGGAGYLPNHEYRGFHQEGRIKGDNIDRALARVGPRVDPDQAIAAGSRRITALDVSRIHLLSEIEALEPKLLEWTLKADG